MRPLLALCAAVVLLAACATSGSESDGGLGAGGPVVEIALKDGKVTPQGKRVQVKVGQEVALHVTSDVDEELHVHSDPERFFAVAPGDDRTFTFTVTTPGQVAVEAHHLDVTVAQLVVRP